jgi:hypothetical protein
MKDTPNRRVMINEEQVNAFAKLMEDKGYTGEFIDGLGTQGSLSTLLGLFMMRESQRQAEGKPTELFVSTVTEVAPKLTHYTSCHFTIDYDREKGFTVKEALISRDALDKKKDEEQKIMQIPIRTQNMIPPKEVVNKLGLQLDKIQVKVYRIKQQFGFSMN